MGDPGEPRGSGCGTALADVTTRLGRTPPRPPPFQERARSDARRGKVPEARWGYRESRGWASSAGTGCPAPSVREAGEKMSLGASRWLVAATAARSGALGLGPAARKAGSGLGQGAAPSRSLIATRSGAILPKPAKNHFIWLLEKGRTVRILREDVLRPPPGLLHCDSLPLCWDTH
ncbi:essential MCU regulator, mitochondrial isoform X3 [Sarcophilus harrisii]|uniref:essential MCU regulator, mitochondrial isoform X3 n=1 Tax=Sarcophilus harrisii TaxID=9305 RepID=UPI001301E968|nr:essential MCU regulator, mitochondrial isoform X3 [Sarcophilus harrisii]